MHDERITLKTRKIQTVEGGRIEGERVGKAGVEMEESK